MQGFVGARQSMNNWEDDRDRLAEVGRHLGDFISDHRNYQRFMGEFITAMRVESPLAIDQFGNPQCETVDENLGLHICANASHALFDNCIIANGAKQYLDQQSLELVRLVAESPGVTLRDILDDNPVHEADKLKQLATRLCCKDILQISER